MAPLWASLSECINCPYMIVPYSKFDWINIYIFVQLGQDASDGSYVLVCFFAWGVKESSYLLWFLVLALKTFLRQLQSMVTGICPQGALFFLSQNTL